MRATFTLFLLGLFLLPALPAQAGDEGPSPAELARLIHEGNPAEHALVAAWLEQADRKELIAVFRALRERRARHPLRARPPALPPRPAPTVRARKEPNFRLPLPEKYRKPPPGKQTVITAEVIILEVDAVGAAAFLGKHRPTVERKAVALTAAEAESLLRAVERRPDARRVSAPRITVYDGQKANVSVLNQVSYVKDYQVETGEDGKQIAAPVVAVIQEGTVIELRPQIAPGKQSIDCAFSGTFATIRRPIPEKDLVLEEAGGRKVKIQLPEVAVSSVNTSLRLPDDGWALIGDGLRLEPKPGEAVERVTLVHVKQAQVDADFVAPR